MSSVESTKIGKAYLFIENRDKLNLQKLKVKLRIETNEIRNCNGGNNKIAAMKIWESQ